MFEKLWKKILRRPDYSLWGIPALLFWFLSFPYRLLVYIKRIRVTDQIEIDTPLISIGNISVGGTGKTPLVSIIARFLLNEGYRVGIVSSGYSREIEDAFIEPGYKVQNMSVALTSDEVKFLANKLPEAVFSVDSDKSRAAINLSQTKEVDLIIIDDGFQHFKIKRDIDIVTYDAGIKARHLKLFPYGVLREPLSSLKRADMIIITRSNFAKDITRLRKKLKRINPDAVHYHAQFSSRALVGENQELSDKYLEDKSVFLFAGIGNFSVLEKQVKALSADLDYAMELNDHQKYTPELLDKIKSLADDHQSDVILTTGKDRVKIENFDFNREFYYLDQIIDLDPGEEKLVKYIEEKLSLNKKTE